jgi:hypothetical protein
MNADDLDDLLNEQHIEILKWKIRASKAEALVEQARETQKQLRTSLERVELVMATRTDVRDRALQDAVETALRFVVEGARDPEPVQANRTAKAIARAISNLKVIP